MLMRTDPFRDLDRLTQQVFGTVARPAAMPMEAYRKGTTSTSISTYPGSTPTPSTWRSSRTCSP